MSPPDRQTRTDGVEQRKPSKPGGFWPPTRLLDANLRGLGEMDQFADDRERKAALREIARQAGSPLTVSFWLAILIVVSVTLAASWLSRWLLGLLPLPDWLREVLRWSVAAVAFFVVLRALHRWGAAGELRRQLLASGRPVCEGCGYSLHGLTADVARCPECGRPIDESVRQMSSHGGEPPPGPRR